MIILNLVLKSFVLRVRENLLDFDFDRLGDVDEAANALSRGRRVDLSGHQDAVVECLETHIQEQSGPLLDADDGVAEALDDRRLELELAHFAGAVNDIEDADRVRGFIVMGHTTSLAVGGWAFSPRRVQALVELRERLVEEGQGLRHLRRRYHGRRGDVQPVPDDRRQQVALEQQRSEPRHGLG